MGMRGCNTAPVSFVDCEVPAENMLGPEGMGFVQAMKTLTQGRVTLASRCIGMMDKLIAKSAEHMKLRSQGGHKLAEYQGLQWMLADMAKEIAAARALVHHAALLIDNDQPANAACSMAKLFAGDMVVAQTSNAVQIFGGSGFIRGFEVERLYRDAKICQIYEGTHADRG